MRNILKVIIVICILSFLVCCAKNSKSEVLQSYRDSSEHKTNPNESKEKSNKTEITIESKNNIITVKELQNPFEKNLAKVNDKVCNMTIKEIFDDSNIIHFTGQARISGKYKHEDDEVYFGKIISFVPDEKSIERIPKLVDDDRQIWFIFTNYEEAVKELGAIGSEGEATIIIDEYMIDASSTETCNEVKLVKVIEKQ